MGRALERWLRGDVAAAYDKMKARVASARSAAEVRDAIAKAHERATKPT